MITETSAPLWAIFALLAGIAYWHYRRITDFNMSNMLEKVLTWVAVGGFTATMGYSLGSIIYLLQDVANLNQPKRVRADPTLSEILSKVESINNVMKSMNRRDRHVFREAYGQPPDNWSQSSDVEWDDYMWDISSESSRDGSGKASVQSVKKPKSVDIPMVPEPKAQPAEPANIGA